jgi:hypothetical protein
VSRSLTSASPPGRNARPQGVVIPVASSCGAPRSGAGAARVGLGAAAVVVGAACGASSPSPQAAASAADTITETVVRAKRRLL